MSLDFVLARFLRLFVPSWDALKTWSPWARSVTGGTADSIYRGVATDAFGSVYAAGTIQGSESYTFGNSVGAAGTSPGANVVLVKYGADGTPLWAQSLTEADSFSMFYGVATDPSGNVCTAGFINGTGSYSFGAGASAQGSASNYNVILVKYLGRQ
jgi:hypothetical protein